MSVEFEPRFRSTPIDWPGPGAIDLSVHDLPHKSSKVEWWYVNSHLTATDGRQLSMFAAFFRVDVSAADAPQKEYGHFLVWALIDPQTGRYFPHTLLDPKAPRLALDDLNKGHGIKDARMARAMREVLERGRVPLPDRVMIAEATVAEDTLSLDFGGNLFVKQPDGAYEVRLSADGGTVACALRFALLKPVVRHGDDGVVRGLNGEDMFYYFSPRCAVAGMVTIDGASVAVGGSGWYDHEFGEHRDELKPSNAQVGWNWVAVQLDNGHEISAYDLFDRDDRSLSHGRWVVIVDPSGRRTAYSDFSFESSGCWTSTRTFNEYPTSYRLRVPAAALDLQITAVMPQQECITIIAAPAFWEGVMDVAGLFHGCSVRGRAIVERSGASVVETTDDFFASVGRETRRAIDQLLPATPTVAQAVQLLGGPAHPHHADGVDVEQYTRTVITPLREILLRGGKAWRSYGMLACMDAVGGHSQAFSHWLAFPELLHVGSLIVDDVQDRSDVRRGGPACHLMFGEPLAINAGCAGYFLAMIPIAASRLPDAMRVRLYEAYFEAMRGAHGGQGLDLDTLAGMMPAVVEQGDGELLERRVLGIHRLKSAVPPAALARMSVLIGGGTEAQSDGLADLFESYGLAFQIIDDVLNLRGFDENRKRRGEDITAGKITAPVAKAMGRLPLDDRRELWRILVSRPDDSAAIRRAVTLIDGCGALDACEAQARELVEAAWARVDALLDDSQFKVRLRAFGWFVLDRHY